MLKDLVDVGGSGLFVPAVLSIVVLYGARALFSLHGRRGQHRREFLELWDSNRIKDDFWLEISIRHLFGAYLPAHVIRIALSQPDRGKSLKDLVKLWPQYWFETDSLTVGWRHTYRQKSGLIVIERALWILTYIFLAFAAVDSALTASRAEPTTFFAWVHWTFALVAVGTAFHCLNAQEAAQVAASSGNSWISRINSAAPKPELPAQQD